MNVRRAPERLQVRANRLWIWAIITQPVFSLVFAGHQPWWALNILFVFAGVTQLLALQYRFGRKGSLAGALLLAIMIWPLSPASYGLAGVALATGMVITTGGQKPGVQLTGIIVSVLALCCLNGLSHLLSLPADTLLFATLPTLVFPDGPVPEHSSVSGRLPALHATTFLLHCLYRPSSGAAPPDAPLVREPQFRGVSAPGTLAPLQ
jgi:hypothetical protein